MVVNPNQSKKQNQKTSKHKIKTNQDDHIQQFKLNDMHMHFYFINFNSLKQ